MKYVILKAVVGGVARVYPVIFPEAFVHESVARHMQHIMGFDMNVIPEIHSAGHCHLWNNQWQVERGSETLKITRGHPAQGHEDHKILNMPNSLQGIMP